MSLIVEHINKSFGQVQAIVDLSMEVEEGALFGLLGANGAGKTTTMRMILDIFRPDSGQITWNGKEVREVARRNWGLSSGRARTLSQDGGRGTTAFPGTLEWSLQTGR